MLRAGVAAHDLDRICVTHFHGDHSLGLAGVIQRINLDQVPHPVTAHFPRSGQRFFDRLRHSTAYRETVGITEAPVDADGVLATTASYRLETARLSHPVESYGYRIVEPDGRRMLPERLAAHGIEGPDVGRIQREGSVGGVSLDEVSEVRRGQRFAFVMDTRLCDGVHALADGADLLVIESTFLDEDETRRRPRPSDRRSGRPGGPGRRGAASGPHPLQPALLRAGGVRAAGPGGRVRGRTDGGARPSAGAGSETAVLRHSGGRPPDTQRKSRSAGVIGADTARRNPSGSSRTML